MAKNKMDLTRGSVLKSLLLFAIPIVLTNILQQLYHAADMIVVGNFAQDSTASLAAVGSTNSITALCLNLFVGLAVGANVVCAKLFGARKEEELRRAMHTSILLAVLCGVGIGLFGFFTARTLLIWTSVPETVLNEATLYMQIIFLGQPGSIVYNFGASILRSHGDTKRPMYVLSAAGVLNVLLNLVFVIVFHLDAAGVALATIIAHYLSAGVILFFLFHPGGDYQLELLGLRLDRDSFEKIIKIGVPSGLNGMMFSLSNVVVISAINSFGDLQVAGNSAAYSVECILYQILGAFYSACVSFSGQNFGVKDFSRIDRLLWQSTLCADGLILVSAVVISVSPGFFLGLFTEDAEVIRLGIPRILTTSWGYLLYAVSEMAIGCSRGMGKSAVPAILNGFFICVPRLIWVFVVMPIVKGNYAFLILCYPVSWILSSMAQLICYFYYRRSESKKHRIFLAEAAALAEKEKLESAPERLVPQE